jgi:hypothetical protein
VPARQLPPGHWLSSEHASGVAEGGELDCWVVAHDTRSNREKLKTRVIMETSGAEMRTGCVSGRKGTGDRLQEQLQHRLDGIDAAHCGHVGLQSLVRGKDGGLRGRLLGSGHVPTTLSERAQSTTPALTVRSPPGRC